MRVYNKRTADIIEGKPKIIEPDKLEYGEFAVNYAAGNETVMLKNDNDEVVTLPNNKTIEEVYEKIEEKCNLIKVYNKFNNNEPFNDVNTLYDYIRACKSGNENLYEEESGNNIYVASILNGDDLILNSPLPSYDSVIDPIRLGKNPKKFKKIYGAGEVIYRSPEGENVVVRKHFPLQALPEVKYFFNGAIIIKFNIESNHFVEFKNFLDILNEGYVYSLVNYGNGKVETKDIEVSTITSINGIRVRNNGNNWAKVLLRIQSVYTGYPSKTFKRVDDDVTSYYTRTTRYDMYPKLAWCSYGFSNGYNTYDFQYFNIKELNFTPNNKVAPPEDRSYLIGINRTFDTTSKGFRIEDGKLICYRKSINEKYDITGDTTIHIYDNNTIKTIEPVENLGYIFDEPEKTRGIYFKKKKYVLSSRQRTEIRNKSKLFIKIEDNQLIVYKRNNGPIIGDIKIVLWNDFEASQKQITVNGGDIVDGLNVFDVSYFGVENFNSFYGYKIQYVTFTNSNDREKYRFGKPGVSRKELTSFKELKGNKTNETRGEGYLTRVRAYNDTARRLTHMLGQSLRGEILYYRKYKGVKSIVPTKISIIRQKVK